LIVMIGPGMGKQVNFIEKSACFTGKVE
jgi:hypothetical protein